MEIRATTAARDGRPGVALAVRDTGTGIPPDHLERIFDPFFSTKRNDGTGLGLSICQDIVRAHDGAIAVESAPGAGTCFSVSAAPGPGGGAGVSETRVLVVDDDVEVVRLLEQDLAAAGFAVVPACSGAAAVRLLRDTRVDAVVTDLRMPDVDGLEIVRAAAESQPEAKVIIITAFASVETAVEAMKRGATDYLTKPISRDDSTDGGENPQAPSIGSGERKPAHHAPRSISLRQHHRALAGDDRDVRRLEEDRAYRRDRRSSPARAAPARS